MVLYIETSHLCPFCKFRNCIYDGWFILNMSPMDAGGHEDQTFSNAAPSCSVLNSAVLVMIGITTTNHFKDIVNFPWLLSVLLCSLSSPIYSLSHFHPRQITVPHQCAWLTNSPESRRAVDVDQIDLLWTHLCWVLEKLREDLALMSAVICLKNHLLLFYYINVNVSGLLWLSKVFYRAVQKKYIYIYQGW